MPLREVLGENVRRVRLARRISQEALAHEAKLAVTYVGQLERGRRNPTLSVVEKLADALDVDPLVLLKAPEL